MANKYNFLPDFSMFDTADQNDATTEDTNSSLMSRNSKADADPAASREEFLKSFYDNLRSSFETEDMFRKTFPSRKRPKPNQSEIEDYINRSTRAKGIDDALFEATGMYKAGTPSDAGMVSLEDVPDGITVPKQPEIQVEELSSAGSTGSIGEYLRTRKNKGSSFVGEGVQMAGAGSLSVEDMDLARMMAGQTMRKEAAKMGLPVVDMEEEERKALEYAKTIPKLSTLKGEGIMSPKKEESEVEAAEEITPVVEDTGSPREQPSVQRNAFNDSKTFALLKGVEGFKTEPYSLNNKTTINNKPHKSGLTVGAGLDFGQHDEASLKSMGVSQDVIDRVSNAGWLGLNPDTIIDPKTKEVAATRNRGHQLMYEKYKEQKKANTLPKFTEQELASQAENVYKTYESSARKQYDSMFGLDTFDGLDESIKAVLSLQLYHYGANTKLPRAMLDGARAGDPIKTASAIKWESREKNTKDWLKKVGFDLSTPTLPRPKARPDTRVAAN